MPSVVGAVVSKVATNNKVPLASTKTVTKTKNAVMVLGMHHLGTSMLSGLLVQGFGYHVSTPLIGTGLANYPNRIF
jgi:hypothetical protein